MSYIHYQQKFSYQGISSQTIDKILILSSQGTSLNQIVTETDLGINQIRRIIERAVKEEGFKPATAKGGRPKTEITKQDIDNVKLINNVVQLGMNATFDVFQERLYSTKLNLAVSAPCTQEQQDALKINQNQFI
ncbi:Hypothetical_protein [Hexamita inflata]|uniref:Hypothetical_protein n=1 Tax=Hexamita inflata TaxID=28002 RepID=A0AA86NPE4_9EUKA|nr:Hypothetical protein HINF_LOCUS11682 [Hexamita inflata]